MSERSAVQNPMLRYADAIGWTYIPPDEALKLRNGDTGLYFTQILTAQLLKLNPTVVTPDRTIDIRRRLNLLELTQGVLEISKSVLLYKKQGVSWAFKLDPC